jgi:hypothetical protein
MTDPELLKQLEASRTNKTRNIVGNTDRFEWDRRKASRLSEGVPYHMEPDMRPKDESAPQALGEGKNNLRADHYPNEVADYGRAQDKWADGRLGSGVNDGPLKPGNSYRRDLGASYSGSGSAAAHAVGRPTARNLPKDPATTGRGRRR